MVIRIGYRFKREVTVVPEAGMKADGPERKGLYILWGIHGYDAVIALSFFQGTPGLLSWRPLIGGHSGGW